MRRAPWVAQSLFKALSEAQQATYADLIETAAFPAMGTGFGGVPFDEAARQMLRGWARGEFEIHFPKRFTRIMKMLSFLPFGIYQAVVRKASAP